MLISRHRSGNRGVGRRFQGGRVIRRSITGLAVGTVLTLLTVMTAACSEPEPQADGKVRHRPFHSYTMKQAIQERFILDVLAHYTPVESYYKLTKVVEDDQNNTADAAAAQFSKLTFD